MRLALAAISFIVVVACIQTAPPPQTAPRPGPTQPETLPEAESPAPAGAACLFANECASGVCEGLGCGDIAGRCTAADRTCTGDVVPYCSCDGKTFYGSSGCPNQRYAAKGACEGQASGGSSSPLPAGSACDRNGDCTSGICEGQGCGAKQGVCAQKQRRCTRDLVTYCGCDGQNFRASSRCPGQRYSKRGACEQASKKPVGASCDTGDQCDSGICEGQGCGPG
ncbi:MAG: hypothetical protein KJO07_13045, partial [Deltaproteobacteria bacterium]|nr:hypothetical protein [Deltaproteobacteria bacterium]